MKDKQLMIGIPTKDHAKYIQYLLAKVLPQAKKYNIDIYIYDSSVDDETEKIVQGRITQGYNNLYYRRYNEDLLLEEKLEYIFVDSGYQYVWLCGDGVVINLEKDIDIVEREIGLNRDLIIFGNMLENGSRYTEYDDAIQLLRDCWAPVTYYGASIVRGDLFTAEQWKYYQKRYLEQIQPACFFEAFLNCRFKAVYIVHDFYEVNPYKKMSSWMKKGRAFEAFAGLMTRTIELLPAEYDSVKKTAQKSIDKYTKVFGISHLWALRINGNLDFGVAMKYRKQIKKASDTKFIVILLISMCPKNIANSIAVIMGNIW